MAESQRTSEPINFVHQDEIWKAHVKMEKTSTKVWPKKWGLLTEVHEEYERESVKLKEKFSVKEIQPLTPAEKDIQISPSPAVPQTSQAFIGWRSGHSHLQLEKPGIVHYGRCSFLKKMGWPLDSCS